VPEVVVLALMVAHLFLELLVQQQMVVVLEQPQLEVRQLPEQQTQVAAVVVAHIYRQLLVVEQTAAPVS
jgi:hypothetical protein